MYPVPACPAPWAGMRTDMTPLLCWTLLVSSAGSDLPPSEASLKLVHACGDRRARVEAPYDPQPGDIVLVQWRSLTLNALTCVTLCAGATHSAIVVPRKDGSLALLETPMIGSCVQINDLVPALASKRCRMWVRRRCPPLTPEQSANLTAFACSQEGKPYDYCGLFTMPLCRPLQCFAKSAPDARELDQSHWFCSALVVGACVAANLLDPHDVRLNCICPTDLMHDRLVDLSHGWEKPLPLLVEKAGCRSR